MNANPSSQRGAVLLVALIFLLVLTLLGVSSMDGTILETKMSMNTQEKNWSFQVAEAALRQATELLSNEDQVLLNNAVTNSGQPIPVDNNQGIQFRRKDGNDIYSAYARNITIEYKGGFPMTAATTAANANSKKKSKVVYFEARSTGQNWVKNNGEFEDGLFPLQTTLRSGYRQKAPADDSKFVEPE